MKVVPFVIPEIIVPAVGMEVPVMFMPGRRPAVPPAAKVSAEPVELAGWLIVTVVVPTLVITVPPGMPGPLMPMFTERPATLPTVMVLLPTVVAPPVIAVCAARVMVVVAVVVVAGSETCPTVGVEVSPASKALPKILPVVSQLKFVPSVNTARPPPMMPLDRPVVE